MNPPFKVAPSKRTAVRAPPRLDALRAELGDAVVEARLAEARKREEHVRRLEVAVAGGASFAAAARGLGAAVAAATLRLWVKRWRSHGLLGLVDVRRGPGSRRQGAGSESPADPQLALAVGDPSARPAAELRTRRSHGPQPGLLKWGGSKQPVVERLAALAPERFDAYHEPFVGGGALFFALRPGRAHLGDRNAELVNVYRVVRDDPDVLVAALGVHRNTREHYLAVRGLDPDALPPVERAARTVFLNRTCFNGLYRVNRHGLFNVPYGRQAHTTFLHPPAIRAAHQALQGVEVLCEDFEACASRARAGDFVYLDPPYPEGLNRGRSFKYQALGFGPEDQIRVAALFRLLDARGCLVMASNADTPLTRQAYAGYEVQGFTVARGIGGSQARRGRAAEIVVRNYTGRRGALPGIAG